VKGKGNLVNNYNMTGKGERASKVNGTWGQVKSFGNVTCYKLS